ncbi:MAG TPA: hypothetical protein P5543_01520 [Planctomycetota bacterium]|nr:hypothetical protein [Planctomycetota bacterium]
MLLLVIFSVYGVGFKNDFALDDWIMLDSAYPREISDSFDLLRISVPHNTILVYRPWTYFSFIVDRNLYGVNAVGFHVTNFFLAVFVSYALYCVLSLYFSKELSLCGSLLFAVFPGHSEAVIGIFNRSQMLSLLFSLIAFLLFVKYMQLPTTEEKCLSSKYRNIFLFISIMFSTILSCFSKETGCITPGLFILAMCTLPSRNVKRVILGFVGCLCSCLIYLALRQYVTGTLSMPNLDPAVRADTISELFFYSFRIFAEYIRLSIFPYPLSCDYNLTLSSPHWTGIFVFVLLGSLVAIFSKKKTVQMLGFGFLWFYGMLFPALNWIPIQISFAERLLYSAFPGMICIFLACMQHVPRKIFLSIFFILFSIYSVLTYQHVLVWENNETLWEHTLQVMPDSYRSYIYQGNKTLQNQKYQQSMKYYEKALTLQPNHHNIVSILYNQAYLFVLQEDIEKAHQKLQQVFDIEPTYRLARRLQGRLYKKEKQYDKAIQAFQQALPPVNKYDRNYAIFPMSIGECYISQGLWNKAEQAYLFALKYDNNNVDILFGLAYIYKHTYNTLAYRNCIQAIQKINPHDGRLQHYK